MARNGSGGFSLLVNTWNPATTGVSATVTDWQALINDIATAMQQSVSSDGQTAMTGNLAMGNNKLTGLSAGTATGHSLRWEQLFSQGTIANLASATTTDIGAQNTSFLNITGTTTITGFGTNYNGPRYLVFAGILTLTHSATLVCPGAANITTAANDAAIAIPISGGWQIVAYQKASGLPTSTTGLVPTGLATASGLTMNTARILGRTTAATGAIEELTSAQVEAFIAATSSSIQPITAAVASNALTITLNPTVLDFRSATITSGTVNRRTVSSAISVVISSGSTLGTTNAVQSRLAVLAIDNAGTVELATINTAGGNDLSETGVITTVAEGGAGAADSATVFYSTTARTGVPYRVVGYVESTQATAGTWATAPSTIQGSGGVSVAATGSIGYGQTWQSVTRATATTYYNTTGKPIITNWNGTHSSGASTTWTINGVTGIGQLTNSSATPQGNSTQIMIPVGASYSLVVGAGTFTSITAHELR